MFLHHFIWQFNLLQTCLKLKKKEVSKLKLMSCLYSDTKRFCSFTAQVKQTLLVCDLTLKECLSFTQLIAETLEHHQTVGE